MRAAVILSALVMAVPSPAPPAPGGADAIVSGHVEDGTPVAEAGVALPEGRDAPRRGGGAARDGGGAARDGGGSVCTDTRLGPGEVLLDSQGRPQSAPAGTVWAVRKCSSSWALVRVAAAPDSTALAREAMRRLRLPAPQVGVSPSADQEQLVNLPTWLWVADLWESRSATASVPGVSVTVTAVPRSVVWDMGTGEQVVCPGPGTPYDHASPEDAQSPDCSYTYRWPSAGRPGQRYPVTATMVWEVTWTAAGTAGGGDLGQVSRSTSFGLRVAESQALVVGAGMI